MSTMNLIKKTVKNILKPSIWSEYKDIVAKSPNPEKVINLGEISSDISPPKLFLEALKKNVSNLEANHQYTRAFGSLKLVNAISNNYSKILNRKIDPLNEISVSAGSSSIIYNSITGLINEGDEICLLEPFNESYYAQAMLSGAKVVGIPLTPPNEENEEMKNSLNKNKHVWSLDLSKFEKSLNEKTKIIILNTPHNPTGKVFTINELEEISKIIIKKSPKAIVLSDESCEHLYYDNHTSLPRISSIPEMWDRTISIYSAANTFSCTGIRIGWAIGPESLIKAVNVVHQYNAFCLYDPIQSTIADCLTDSELNYEGFSNYYEWLRNFYKSARNDFANKLIHSENQFLNKNSEFKCYLPEGGTFLIGDISKINLQYNIDENERSNEFTKELISKNNLLVYPLNAFYSPENKKLGRNFIRFSFVQSNNNLNLAFKH
jgi:aspartate/methionine/tyrosine aminotransferase